MKTETRRGTESVPAFDGGGYSALTSLNPTECTYAPPTFPEHDDSGSGIGVNVYKNGSHLGVITWIGDPAVSYSFIWGDGDFNDAAAVARVFSSFAKDDRSLQEAIDQVLTDFDHDEPKIGQFQGLVEGSIW